MKIAVSLVALGAICSTVVGVARAQPPEQSQAAPYLAAEQAAPGVVAAPTNAFELSLGTGYTQGFGNLKSGTGLPSVVTPGIAFELGLGYRIDPNWAVLWSGQFAEMTAERTSTARGFTSGIAVQYHISPMQKVDPWVEAGAGYRFLLEDPSVGPNLLTHGFQLGRLRAGLDFRPDPNVALGPMIGADATMFLFQDIPNVDTNISNPTVSTFIFAGLQGRFDMGGRTTTGGPRPVAAASRQ